MAVFLGGGVRAARSTAHSRTRGQTHVHNHSRRTVILRSGLFPTTGRKTRLPVTPPLFQQGERRAYTAYTA